MKQVSNSEANRLGDSLRQAAKNEEALDVEALEEYRLSYWHATQAVVKKLSQDVDFSFTLRTKSTESIVAKLIRQPNTRLSQIQDVVGFRYVVSDLQRQDDLCKSVGLVFPAAKVVDRRIRPQYGYRAVHLIVTEESRKIEIQIRTLLQHLWAQYSETLADRVGHELKYGGGDERIRKFLTDLAEKVRLREFELQERKIVLSYKQMHEEFAAMLPTADTL
jgi:ppGpp synthetase/RelA/SpoT-type nucleotidyltranferase